MKTPRKASVNRTTGETEISLELNLDGEGLLDGSTGIGFFDHMLNALARHSGFDIVLTCRGDLHVDEHHTMEDLGLVLGQALGQAVGDKAGISRFADACVPLDESLSRVAVDFSGRGLLVFRGSFSRERVGSMPTELVEEFWRAVASKAQITLHMEILYGTNAHHQAESLFKAAARSLGAATRLIEGKSAVPSTKGVL